MNKDDLYFRAYQFGKTSIGNNLIRAYYKVAIFLVKRRMRKWEWVESAHLKGSYLNDSFLLGISDLDFFIIGEVTEQRKKQLKKYFDRIHLFFPMLRDFDFHTSEDASFLLRFGGAKFFFQKQWICLKGSPIRIEYYYHPLKFYLDIIQEIYFQFEYLIVNLKKDTKMVSEYRSLIIHRQYYKILDLLNRVAAFDSRKSWINHNIVMNESWKSLKAEEVIKRFNDAVENHLFAKWFNHWLKDRVSKDYLTESLETGFFQNRINIFKDDIIIDKSDIYLTQSNLELFYYSGCIDSSILWKYSLQILSYNHTDILKIKYYSHLLEGYPNYLHDFNFYAFNRKKVLKLADQINESSHFVNQFSGYLKNIIFIYGTPRNDVKKIIETCDRAELIFLNSKNIFAGSSRIDNLNLELTLEKNLSKELVDMAQNWGLGAKNICLIDSDFFNKKNLDILLNKLNQSQAFIAQDKYGRIICLGGNSEDLDYMTRNLFIQNNIVTRRDFDKNLFLLEEGWGHKLLPPTNNSDINIFGDIITLEADQHILSYTQFYSHFDMVNSLGINDRKEMVKSVNHAILSSHSEEELFYSLTSLLSPLTRDLKLEMFQKSQQNYYVVGNSIILPLSGAEIFIRSNNKNIYIYKFETIKENTPYELEFWMRGSFSKNDFVDYRIFELNTGKILTENATASDENYYSKFWSKPCDNQKVLLQIQISLEDVKDIGIEKYILTPMEKENFYKKIEQNDDVSMELFSGVYKFVVYTGKSNINQEYTIKNKNGDVFYHSHSNESVYVFYLKVLVDDIYTFDASKEFSMIDILKFEK